jgi:NAD(P)-dependent dehydrogenase (short-subunit alcohol dehydrogenase family)
MKDTVAVVTGASRGVGRGIAAELSAMGATVYATGRTIQQATLPASVHRVTLDHRDDDSVDALFARVESERGKLDILVNSVWGGYERMVEGGQFTWPWPFWQQPRWRWTAMLDTGVRAALIASQNAAKRMVQEGRGLIVNVSHWAAQKHLGNTIYGVSKAATDKLTADMAAELLAHRVAVVSLYPGLVRTETVLAAGVFDLSNSESPEYQGRAVAALYNDPSLLKRTGRVVASAALGAELGFDDIDGKRQKPLTLDDV